MLSFTAIFHLFVLCQLSWEEERLAAHRQHLLPPLHDDQPPRPEFDPSTPVNVTALVGRDAQLTCIVRNIGNHTVSWIRQTDLHILTAGRYTYTTDLRFEAFHSPGSAIWTLSIQKTRSNDSGLYDCQISTKPETSLEVQFNVVERLPAAEEPGPLPMDAEGSAAAAGAGPTSTQPSAAKLPVARILGAGNVYVQRDSDLNLTCQVSYSPEPTMTVEWLHRNKVVSFTSSRGGISVITAKGHRTTSHLLLQRAQPADSGPYTCSPDNAEPATVTVHILDGETPAAMQTGSSTFSASGYALLSNVLLLFTAQRLLTGVR